MGCGRSLASSSNSAAVSMPSSHTANAGAVRIGPRSFTVDVARDAVIARYEPQPITQDKLLAHYYNNQSISSPKKPFVQNYAHISKK